MSRHVSLSILSDIHYASAAEQARRRDLLKGISNPFIQFLVKYYRHFFWLRDPFAHNHLLDEYLRQSGEPDFVIANGDYSCDTAYIGVLDNAAFASATECLGKLRGRFDSRVQSSFGDHELGKTKMGCAHGGLRIGSYDRARDGLGLKPFWQVTIGNYVLIGLVSTVVALPIYEREALPEEVPVWRQLREQHLRELSEAFAAIKSHQRILLFCHDPTALPFLWREDAIRSKVPQIERTIIGHLHSPLILRQTRLLAGLPSLRFLGHTTYRISCALREARLWKPFNVLLCPSLAGIELLKDGGYYSGEIDPQGDRPARFQFHRLAR